ncbi:hypothetical protein EDD11_004956 [Mortierella claussenii]|nr:hypothetical protein EDD11_004956 [Mortierella claussenii]
MFYYSGSGAKKPGRGIPIDVPTTQRRPSNFSLQIGNPLLLTGSRDGGSSRRKSSTSSQSSAHISPSFSSLHDDFDVVGQIGSSSKLVSDRPRTKSSDIVLLSDEDEHRGPRPFKRKKLHLHTTTTVAEPSGQSASLVSRMKKHSTPISSELPVKKATTMHVASGNTSTMDSSCEQQPAKPSTPTKITPPSRHQHLASTHTPLAVKAPALGMGTFPQATISSIRLGSRVELTTQRMSIQFGPDRFIITIDKNVTKIPHDNIKCVDYNTNGKPIIFAIQTKEALAEDSALEPYYDPAPLSGKARRIVLLSDSDAMMFVECCRRLERKRIPIKELSSDTVGKILTVVPKRSIATGTSSPKASSKTSVSTRSSKVTDETARTKSIAVHAEDMSRLNEGEFLNDTLIEFGLKYVHANVESRNSELADKTYIFNSFFYERLLTKSGKGIQYEAVKSWTNKIDIFSKKYIVIPIHEQVHWYLAIVTNPGLLLRTEHEPERKADPEPTASPDSTSSSKSDMPIPSSSSSLPPKSPSSSDTYTESSGLIPTHLLPLPTRNGKSSDDGERGGSKRTLRSSTAVFVDPEEKPYIIVLDSLGGFHPGVFRSLRMYLQQELMARKDIDRTIDAKDVPGKLAKCPQQENFCDCGLYLLHYAEVFLKYPEALLNIIVNKTEDANKYWGDGELLLKREKFREIMIALAEQYKTYLFSQQQIEQIKEASQHRSDPPSNPPSLSAEKEAFRTSTGSNGSGNR